MKSMPWIHHVLGYASYVYMKRNITTTRHNRKEGKTIETRMCCRSFAGEMGSSSIIIILVVLSKNWLFGFNFFEKFFIFFDSIPFWNPLCVEIKPWGCVSAVWLIFPMPRVFIIWKIFSFISLITGPRRLCCALNGGHVCTGFLRDYLAGDKSNFPLAILSFVGCSTSDQQRSQMRRTDIVRCWELYQFAHSRSQQFQSLLMASAVRSESSFNLLLLLPPITPAVLPLDYSYCSLQSLDVSSSSSSSSYQYQHLHRLLLHFIVFVQTSSIFTNIYICEDCVIFFIKIRK